jgi:hypothetical protein
MVWSKLLSHIKCGLNMHIYIYIYIYICVHDPPPPPKCIKKEINVTFRLVCRNMRNILGQCYIAGNPPYYLVSVPQAELPVPSLYAC